MPLVANDVVRISLIGECLDQQIQFVSDWYLEATQSLQTPVEDELDILSEVVAAGNAYLSTYLSCMPENYTLRDVRVQAISALRHPYVNSATNDPGTIPSAATTPNIAATFMRYGEIAGRDKISVSHIGPIPPNSFTGGVVNDAHRTRLFILADKWLTSIVVPNPAMILRPCVQHRNPLNPGVAILRYPRVGTTVRTMRRRTVEIGV